MKRSKSNDFAIHIFHGHIYSFICNAAFILRFSQVWACDTVFPFALHVSARREISTRINNLKKLLIWTSVVYFSEGVPFYCIKIHIV